MMSTATTPGTRLGDALRTWPVWLVRVLAGGVAAIVTELYGLAARAAGIPMAAGSPGAAEANSIFVGRSPCPP